MKAVASMINDVQYSQYVIDHDLKNRIVVIDEGFTRITGYSQLDIKKGNIELYDIIPEKDQGMFIELLTKKLGDKQKAYLNHPIICKDGTVTHVISFVESYKSRAKRHLCSKVLMTDVSVTKSLEHEIKLVRKDFQESQRKLQEKTDLLEGILNNLVGGVGMFEVHGAELVPTYLSDSFYTMLDLDGKQFASYQTNFTKLFHPDDWDRLHSDIEACVSEHIHTVGEYRFYKVRGGYRWLQMRLGYMSAKNSVPVVTAVFMDITERKRTEYELYLQTERFNLIAASNDEQMFEYDPARDFMSITVMKDGEKSIVELLDFVGKLEHSHYIHKDDVKLFKRDWEQAAARPTKASLDFRTKLFSSNYIWYRATYVSLANEEGDGVSRIVGRFVNIQSDVLKQQTLKQTAALDALTKLFNKGFSQAKINKHLYENQEPNALMIIDIDNFKAINDTFGHSYGDAVLKDVSRIIRGSFRVNTDILGRIGGDEFIVLMNNPPSANVVIYKANQLCREIRHTYEEDGKEITISSSIGIAFYPEHGTEFQSLYENADRALYNAKASGKNGFAIYDPAVKMEYHSDRK